MGIQVFAFRLEQGINTSFDQFFPFPHPNPNSEFGASGEAGARMPWPVAGTFRNLRVAYADGTPGGTFDWSLRINGSDTLTAQITGAQPVDTDTGSVAVAAGDLVNLRLNPAGTLGAHGWYISLDFEAATGASVLVGREDGVLGTGTRAWHPYGGSEVATQQLVIPHACTLTSFWICNEGTSGAGGSYVLQLEVDGVDQDGSGGTPDTRLTVNNGVATGTVQSVTFTRALTRGQLLRIKSVSSGAPGAVGISAGIGVLSPTDGDSIYAPAQPNNTPLGATTNYAEAEGFGAGGTPTTEADWVNEIGVTGFSLKNFVVQLNSAVGGSGVTCTLRVDGVSTALAVALGAADTTGSDLVDTVPVVAGEQLSIEAVGSTSAAIRRPNYAFTQSSGASPQVATNAVTAITRTTATLHGDFTGNGVDIDGYFRWGPSNPPTEFSTALQSVGTGGTPVPLTANLSGLVPGATYFVQAVGQEVADPTTEYEGNVVSFSTLADPTVITDPATAVLDVTATLNGRVNPGGLDTSAYFLWDTAFPPTANQTALQALGSGVSLVAVTAGLTGLTPLTTYYFQIIAGEPDGMGGLLSETAGTILSFTTTGPATPSDARITQAGALPVGQTSETRVTQEGALPVVQSGESRITQEGVLPVVGTGETRITQTAGVPVLGQGVTRITQTAALIITTGGNLPPPPPDHGCPVPALPAPDSGGGHGCPVVLP